MRIADRAKHLVHRGLERLGLQASRIGPGTSDQACLQRHLERYGVDLIFDVGANVGQYAESVFAAGYRGRVVSFEPLSHPYAELRERSRGNPRWEVAERCCLGDRDAEIEVHISENSVASSLLPISAEHLRVSPNARYVDVERVRMQTLDSAFSRYAKGARAPFLKLDVQGFESQVLDGAARCLPRMVGFQIELSLSQIYEGEVLFSDMVRRIESLGFQIVRFFPAFTDMQTGRWLAADGLFFPAEPRLLPAEARAAA